MDGKPSLDIFPTAKMNTSTLAEKMVIDKLLPCTPLVTFSDMSRIDDISIGNIGNSKIYWEWITRTGRESYIVLGKFSLQIIISLYCL